MGGLPAGTGGGRCRRVPVSHRRGCLASASNHGQALLERPVRSAERNSQKRGDIEEFPHPEKSPTITPISDIYPGSLAPAAPSVMKARPGYRPHQARGRGEPTETDIHPDTRTSKGTLPLRKGWSKPSQPTPACSVLFETCRRGAS